MFWIRLRSSVILVIAALVLLLTGGWVLAAGLLVLSLIAYRELLCAAQTCRTAEEETDAGKKKKGRFGGLFTVGLLGAAAYYAALLLGTEPVYWLGILGLTFLGMMAVYVITFPALQAGSVMTAFFCFFYGPVLFSFVWLTRQLPGGICMVWLIFISSWICDTCAYLSGMAFGKHRLTPVLSPKKSVEGAVGGVLGSALVGALFGHLLLNGIFEGQEMALISAVICAAGAVISQIGDLAASGIKRNHGIKDYGKLIPGHGGVMDRFDSVLFTAPIIYYLAILLIRFE
ncbi:MAG TPA: phosphatidate cytidylyltransferase [Candidatus Eisenbergiella intestinipullorum]|nr:phosphatidate cytidylyltransferase [Candidatus Eisenbergiella intestinipullorum]